MDVIVGGGVIVDLFKEVYLMFWPLGKICVDAFAFILDVFFICDVMFCLIFSFSEFILYALAELGHIWLRAFS